MDFKIYPALGIDLKTNKMYIYYSYKCFWVEVSKS